MRKAVSVLRRKLWEDQAISGMNRWTVVASNLSVSMDMVAVLYCSVMVRNKLGETVYSSVFELPFQVTKNRLVEISPELWGEISHLETKDLTEKQIITLKPLILDCWGNASNEFQQRIKRLKEQVANDFKAYLETGLKEQRAEEIKTYQLRIKELETEKSPKALEKLKKELAKAEELRKQLTFNEEINLERQANYRELSKQASEAEWERQHSQVMLLKQQLESDQKRLIEKVLPLRYTLSSVDIQPAAVKIIVKEGGLSAI
jgi:hypothetical protein